MKKNILYSILIAGASMVGLSSCDKFLEENARDQITEEQAYQSPTLIYLNTVASLYGYIGANGGSEGLQGTDRGIYDLNTFTTDEAILPLRGGDWNDGGLWQRQYKHSWSTKNQLIKGSWDYLYKVVGQCNASIDKLETLAKKDETNEALPTYIAEVRAIRAMYYYYLCDLFARVPIVTSSKVELKDVVQSNRSEVFNFAKTELEEVLPLLSDQHSNLPGEYYGRITKPVAYFLLAKLALNSEVYTDDNWTDGERPDGSKIMFTVDGEEMNAWEATIAYGNKITALGYQLEKDYAANFSKTNENSKENIFTIPMGKDYTNEFYNLIRSRHYKHGEAYGQGGWNGASATQHVLDVYEYGTDNQDPRFDMNYYYGEIEGPNGIIKLDDGSPLTYVPEAVKLDVTGSKDEKSAGARMKKYELDASATNDGKLQSNDIVLFRYADVLLMISEAKVRNGESGDAEFNLVRARVGTSLDMKATLDNILDERLREFAWEGLRRQDMIRFMKFREAYSHREQIEGEATGYTTVFPIDEEVLSLNTKLTQNYGY